MQLAQSGFSLTELILVLVLTGILAVVVVPQFSDSASFRARGYTDELIAAARAAQKLAVARGCPVRLAMNPSTGYSLRTRSGCQVGAFDTPLSVPPRPPGHVGAPPAGVVLAGSSSIDFFADGSSTGGGASVTALGQTRSFAVIASTGFVQEL
jgi:MSHA pilin protein MshC